MKQFIFSVLITILLFVSQAYATLAIEMDIDLKKTGSGYDPKVTVPANYHAYVKFFNFVQANGYKCTMEASSVIKYLANDAIKIFDVSCYIINNITKYGTPITIDTRGFKGQDPIRLKMANNTKGDVIVSASCSEL